VFGGGDKVFPPAEIGPGLGGAIDVTRSLEDSHVRWLYLRCPNT
jgi:hypothetical protein